MGNIYPNQERAVDPYAEYNSNVVNRLTRMITTGLDCIMGARSVDIYLDNDSPDTSLILTPGEFFKDDVYLHITDEMKIDMGDPDFYVNGVRDEAGIYYIVVDYVFVKSKPAPRASIKIIRPSDRNLFSPNQYLFLKAVDIIFVGPGFTIGELYDHDPENLDVKRIYPPHFAGISDILPEWNPEDESRILYVRSERECYFGTDSGWESFSALRDNQDTSSCLEGDVAYLGPDGKLYPAIIDSTSIDMIADCVVVTVDEQFGRCRLAGYATRVNLETGCNPQSGDKMFLSSTEAGRVTNIETSGNVQYLGVCIEDNFDDTIQMWFVPLIAYNKAVEHDLIEIKEDIEDLQIEIETTGHIFRSTLEGYDWEADGTQYRALVEHNLGEEICQVTCYDSNTKMMIFPANIQIIDSNSLYVWMTINTISLDIVVIG